jgi:hypothetical protein
MMERIAGIMGLSRESCIVGRPQAIPRITPCEFSQVVRPQKFFKVIAITKSQKPSNSVKPVNPAFPHKSGNHLLYTGVTLALAITAHAADITSSSQGPAFTVATGDLLETSVASVSDNVFYNSAYNTPGYTQANLRDGISAGGTLIGKADNPDYGQGGSVTFNLDVGINTLGYDITDISTYTNHGDGGRDGQKYTVSYSLVGSPDFVDIAAVNYLMGDNGTPGSGKVAISSIGASGVDAIRFNFADQENAGSNYSELDVLGSATTAVTAQDGTWTSAADGNWADAANWLDNKPAAGADKTASYTSTPGVNVTVNSSRTIGNIIFDNADYTINGPASLTLATTSGTPTLTVGDNGGVRVATINASLVTGAGLAKAGNGILTLTSPIAPGPVTIQDGILEMLETSGNYNWYGPTSTTVQSGGVLRINSHSAVFDLILSGGELASTGVDLVNGYGSWSLQGDSCTATGGVTSIISAQQVDFNSLANGFVVDTGSTLEITGSLKNGQLNKNGPGLMILAAPRTGTDNTFVNEGILQISDSGGSLRFRPTTNGTTNSITGDADAAIAFNGTMDLDLSAAELADGNTWLLIDGSSFSTPGSLTFGTNFTITSSLGSFNEATPGTWELPVTGAKWIFTESDGILEYTVTATDYDSWASSFNLTGGSTGDDDNDGYSNLEEYAFGLIPNSGSSANPIVVQLNPGTGAFSYTRRNPSLPNPALNYSVWYSTDLTTWSEDAGAIPGTPVLNGEVETVPVTISAGLLANPKLFIQVRAD